MRSALVNVPGVIEAMAYLPDRAVATIQRGKVEVAQLIEALRLAGFKAALREDPNVPPRRTEATAASAPAPVPGATPAGPPAPTLPRPMPPSPTPGRLDAQPVGPGPALHPAPNPTGVPAPWRTMTGAPPR